MTQPDLLTTYEVAAIARVTPSTIRRWVASGQLPAVRLPSGRARYRRDDVQKLMSVADVS